LKREILAVLLIVLSALFLGFFSYYARISQELASLPLAIFLRFLIPMVFCLFFLAFRSLKELFETNIKVQIVRGFWGIVAQYSLFYSLRGISLLDATLLLNTSPLFIPILAWLFLKKRIEWRTGIGLIVGFFGIILVLKPTEGIVNLYAFFGLLAGFSAGTSQVCLQKVSKESKVSTNIFQWSLWCLLFSILPLFAMEPVLHFKSSPGWMFLIVFLTLGIFSFGNQIFRSWGYYLAKNPVNLAPLLYLSVIVSGIIDWVLYQSLPDIFTIAGAVLVVIGAFLSQYNKRSKERPSF